MKDYRSEETVLCPRETSITIDGWIIDAEGVDKPNRYDEYELHFCPDGTNEIAKLTEHMAGCVSLLMRTVSQYSNKEPRPLYHDKRKYFVASQLFQPKINIPYYEAIEFNGRKASINLHARDLPCGGVVINIDYIDFYDLNNGIEDNTDNEETTTDADGW